MYPDCEFETSPVGFLRGVVGVRRIVSGWRRTHGEGVGGRGFGEGDFQGAKEEEGKKKKRRKRRKMTRERRKMSEGKKEDEEEKKEDE